MRGTKSVAHPVGPPAPLIQHQFLFSNPQASLRKVKNCQLCRRKHDLLSIFETELRMLARDQPSCVCDSGRAH